MAFFQEAALSGPLVPAIRPSSVTPDRTARRQESHIDASRSTKDQAVRSLRMLILAGERYRQVLAEAIGLGTTESQALSYLEVHGESGQSELARDLGLTSSALTALVDRLERSGVAERFPHPQDRRRSMIRVTEHGATLVVESHDWLDATLERIDPADLELVSTALALIAEDLFARKSSHQAESA